MVEESGIGLSQRRIWAFILVSVMIGSAFISVTWNVAANRGAADMYGYEWTDSKMPLPAVGYTWMEINATGTASTIWGDDQYGGPYAIGFIFSFYGNAYSQLYFSTNGLITFGSGSSYYGNYPIPSTSSPDNYLAPYWDDLEVQSGIGTVYYKTIGSAPHRQFIVEWDQVRLLSGSNHMKFEAILNETGEVWFQYNYLNGLTGSSATVGIENAAGTDGCQYSYGVPSLSDGLAIRFSQGSFSIGPGQSKGGMSGTAVSYNLTITNRQASSDSFDLTVASALGWSVTLYDSTGMVPLTDTNGDASGHPDSGSVPAAGTFDFVVRVNIPLSPGGTQDSETITAISFSNNSLSRNATLTTKVITAQFDPPHADHGQDTDADGLYDYLVVDVSVDVGIAGSYYIFGTLRDIFLNYIDDSYNWTSLSVGARTVELRFDGGLVNAHGADGQYNVSLFLLDDSFNFTDDDTYLTNAYAHGQFESSSTFDPPHSDYGMDTNADGLFDYLAVDVSVNITSPGYYQLYGTLLDNASNIIDDAYNLTYLDSGIQTVVLIFSGYLIHQNGVNGSYTVMLNLYDDMWNYLDGDIYYTNSYLIASFCSAIGSILSQWAGIFPVIDGTFSPGEWADAVAVDLMGADPSNDLPAFLLVKNDATRLFICYDGTGDTTQDISDAASISFDTGNDELQSNGNEDQFVMSGSPTNNTAHYIYSSISSDWTLECSPFNSMLPSHAGLAGAVGFGSSDNDATDHRVFEFCIPLALLSATPGDVLGFLGASEPSPGIVDTSSFNYSTWPIFFGGPPALSMYGDLFLAVSSQPQVDYIQIRDAPSGGGYLVDDIICDRGETDDYWCAGYNYSSGYVGDFYATWVSSNTGVVTVTSPGASTTMTCNGTNIGTTTITVNYNGKVNTTIINVRDLPHTAAVLSGTSGSNGWYISSVEVNLSATDIMEGVNYTCYRVDSGSWQMYGSPFDVLSDGQHTVSYYSVDLGNNTEKVKSITVNIDKTPPTLTIAQSNGTIFAAASITIFWEGSDATGGIDHYEFSLDGSAFEDLGASATSRNLSGLSVGAHYIIVRAVDRAGLITEKRLDFTIDTSSSGGSFLTDIGPWLIIIAAAIAAMVVLFIVMSRRRRKDGDSSTPPQMPPRTPFQDPPWQMPPQPPFP